METKTIHIWVNSKEAETNKNSDWDYIFDIATKEKTHNQNVFGSKPRIKIALIKIPLCHDIGEGLASCHFKYKYKEIKEKK